MGRDRERGRITLLSVMGSASARLIPFFIAHYRQFGVERFCITLHFEAGQEVERDLALRYLGEAGVEPINVWGGPFEHDKKEQYLASMRSEQAEGDDWWVYADTDEFHEFPVRLATLRAQCLRKGKRYVMGRWIDRLADGGALPEIDPNVDLYRQFPWASHLSVSLGGKSFDATTKLCFVGSDIVPSNSGFHRPKDRNWREDPECWPGLIACNHFKWDQSVKLKLKQRITEWSDVRNSVQEAENFEHHLLGNDDRIDLESILPRQRQYDQSPCRRQLMRLVRYSKFLILSNAMGRTVKAVSGQAEALDQRFGIYV